MENCKHADCCDLGKTWITWGKRGVINHDGWRLPLGDTPIAACPWCLARLEPPKPEVMTLEEVAKELKTAIAFPLTPKTDRVIYGRWLAAITAHLEESRGLTEGEAWELSRLAIEIEAGRPSWAFFLRAIASRHTKGGNKA